jgi:hypothetical protein
MDGYGCPENKVLSANNLRKVKGPAARGRESEPFFCLLTPDRKYHVLIQPPLPLKRLMWDVRCVSSGSGRLS